MANLFFRKEAFSTYFLINGAPAPFEQLDGNVGVMTLDPVQSPDLAVALVAAAADRIGGVIKISQEEYEDLKKKQPWNPSGNRSPRDMLRLFQRERQREQPQPVAPPAPVVAVDNPVPSESAAPPAPQDTPEPTPKPPYRPPVRMVTGDNVSVPISPLVSKTQPKAPSQPTQ